jgi:hypothetical protein
MPAIYSSTTMTEELQPPWLPNFAPAFSSYPFSKPRDSTIPNFGRGPSALGLHLHWAHERGGPGMKNKNCVKVVVYMHDIHTGWSWSKEKPMAGAGFSIFFAVGDGFLWYQGMTNYVL